MNRSKRLFCILMVCMIAGSATLAEEPAPETAAAPAPVITQAPTAEPTAKPTAKPTEKPTPKPTAEPTPKPMTENSVKMMSEPAAEPAAEPTAKSTAEPTAKPTAEPTAMPTAKPTAEPTSVPTAEPTAAATTNPTAEPPADPTAEPLANPTAEPPADPTAEPPADPTAEPPTDPTAEPSADTATDLTTDPTPGPDAGMNSEQEPGATAEPSPEPAAPTAVPIEQIEISVAGNAQCVENVWQISVQGQEEQIAFQWQSVDTASVYEVRIVDSQNAGFYASETGETSLSLPASTFGTDVYVMIVSAYRSAGQGDKSGTATGRVLLKQGVARFTLVQSQDGEFPGGFPGGGFPGGGFPGGGFSGGSFPSGSFPSGGFSNGSMPGGEMPGEEQGFRIVPGEALTSSHTSGTKDMQLYGTVDAKAKDGAMAILTLDDVQLGVTLDDQSSSFYAACEEDALILTPEGEGRAWSVSAFALKVLGRSGIEKIRLVFGEESIEISTGWNLQGSAYARLCAEGYVSKDYILTVTPSETLVSVAGAVYTISENNELVGG